MALGKIKVIRDFFGVREGDALKDFSQEIKSLSDADRLELAQGAALNLGLTQEAVDFPLS